MIVKEARAWLVCMPFAEDILWGSGRRTGATRLIVRLTCEDGTQGWGETISLIDTVPAVLPKLRPAPRNRLLGGGGRALSPQRAGRGLLPPQAGRRDGDLRRRDGHVGRAGQDRRPAAARALGRPVPRSGRSVGLRVRQGAGGDEADDRRISGQGFQHVQGQDRRRSRQRSLDRRERTAANRRPPAPRRRQRRMDARNRTSAACEARRLRSCLYRAAARAGRPPGPCRAAPLPDRSRRAGRERLYPRRCRQHRPRLRRRCRAARSARGGGTVADRESRRHLRGGGHSR